MSEEALLKNKLKLKENNARNGIDPSGVHVSTGGTSTGAGSVSVNNNNNNNNNGRNVRHGDLRLLETLNEVESEKTMSQSMDSPCSTPSSSYEHNGKRGSGSGYHRTQSQSQSHSLRGVNKSHSHSNSNSISNSNYDEDDDKNQVIDEYGILVIECKEDEKSDKDDKIDNESKDDDEEKSQDKSERVSTEKDDEVEHTGLEKFFVKPASEFIVDFFDAFSNIDDGGVALMMEYMDGKYGCTCVIMHLISPLLSSHFNLFYLQYFYYILLYYFYF